MRPVALIKWALALLLVPLMCACADDDDYYGPPRPGGDYGFNELWSSQILAPAICPYYISPNQSDEDERWFDNYDDTYTILNSYRDVQYYFTDKQLRDYPALTQVDFSRYSVVIYTCYNKFEVNSFGYRWGYYYDSNYSFTMLLTFYPTGGKLTRGRLALAQAALLVDKIPSKSDIDIEVDYN